MRRFLLTTWICQGFIKIAQRQHVSAPHCRHKLQLATATDPDMPDQGWRWQRGGWWWGGRGYCCWQPGKSYQRPHHHIKTGLTDWQLWASGTRSTDQKIPEDLPSPDAQSASPGGHLPIPPWLHGFFFLNHHFQNHLHFLYHLLNVAPVSEPSKLWPEPKTNLLKKLFKRSDGWSHFAKYVRKFCLLPNPCCAVSHWSGFSHL